MKKPTQNRICIVLILLFFISALSVTQGIPNMESDYDPLVDIHVSVEILKIRAFDKEDIQLFHREYIDEDSDPDFYVKIIINEEDFISDIWYDTKYIYDPNVLFTVNIPDDQEIVPIRIQLWDWNEEGDLLCDLAGDEAMDVDLLYDVKTGHWSGDDALMDTSGYGRLNGCDDGSIYSHDLDCEAWFTITQTDYDHDSIPYWMEINEYGSDPLINNAEDDADQDDIPLYWEWRWGFDPYSYDDHKAINVEMDGIDNYEEYLTSQWFSDPYRKDLFIELDQMEAGPNGEPASFLPEGSKEILYTAFDRQNVVLHLDDGSWGEDSGSDIIPFDVETDCSWREFDELDQMYDEYFFHGDYDTWRRGVFHYGVIIYQSSLVNGNQFGPNRFQISSKGMQSKLDQYSWLERDTVFASAYMHECGHTFSFWPIPGHNKASYYPWQIGWWLSRPYKSCMNYAYMYTTVDYSDGSRPVRDYDDWERMDMLSFQDEWS